MSTPTLPPKVTWQNWAKNESFETRYAEPRSEAEIVELVRSARSRSEQVRVVGTGHSQCPLHRSTGALVSLDNMKGVVSVDRERGRAVVRAGTKISELGDPLWEQGVALTNQGEIDRQSIAGAIATGTHGTGLRLKNLSSALTRARVVTGLGEIVEIDESTPHELRAARVSLGMLGVMTEIELAVSPAYEITEWLGHVRFEEMNPHILELARRNRNLNLLWLPTHEASVNYRLLPAGRGDGSDTCFVKIYGIGDVDPGPIAAHGSVRRVDRSYRIYPDFWEPQYFDMEYMMPVEAGLECWVELRRVYREEFPDVHAPAELRFTAADDAFLSQNHGRDSAVVCASTPYTGTPSEDFFGRCDELFTAYGGRPHWGKLYRTSVDRLQDQFPGYDEFRAVRRRFDPDGVFLNDHLRPLFA